MAARVNPKNCGPVVGIPPHLNKIGCMNATEHVIELLKDEPVKERFRCIAPLLVDEVCQHIQEMLDGGAN